MRPLMDGEMMQLEVRPFPEVVQGTVSGAVNQSGLSSSCPSDLLITEYLGCPYY